MQERKWRDVIREQPLEAAGPEARGRRGEWEERRAGESHRDTRGIVKKWTGDRPSCQGGMGRWKVGWRSRAELLWGGATRPMRILDDGPLLFWGWVVGGVSGPGMVGGVQMYLCTVRLSDDRRTVLQNQVSSLVRRHGCIVLTAGTFTPAQGTK